MVVGSDLSTLLTIYKEVIDRTGLPTAEIARRMGIQPQTLYNYLDGYKKRPGVFFTVKLFDACGARLLVDLPTAPLA